MKEFCIDHLVGIVKYCNISKFHTLTQIKDMSRLVQKGLKNAELWGKTYFQACFFFFSCIFSPGYCLVYPTYKESLEIDVATHYNVIEILQHFGLLSTLWLIMIIL